MSEQEQTPEPTGERADLLETLRLHRWFLRSTTEGMSEEQVRTRSTVSELTLGGLVKHVAATEQGWADFVVHGPESMAPPADGDYSAWEGQFQLTDDETLAGVLARYDEVAARTDALVADVDLDRAWPLPEAPWFQPGATQTARRTFLHIIAETAQHSGHADIIREAIDGHKTMG